MPAMRELRRAMAVRKKAVVTDAMEAVGEGVEQKASNELVGSECRAMREIGWWERERGGVSRRVTSLPELQKEPIRP